VRTRNTRGSERDGAAGRAGQTLSIVDVSSGTGTPFTAPIGASEFDVTLDGSMVADSDLDENGNAQVFVMDADSSNARQLTRGEGRVGGPGWSPDGFDDRIRTGNVRQPPRSSSVASLTEKRPRSPMNHGARSTQVAIAPDVVEVKGELATVAAGGRGVTASRGLSQRDPCLEQGAALRSAICQYCFGAEAAPRSRIVVAIQPRWLIRLGRPPRADRSARVGGVSAPPGSHPGGDGPRGRVRPQVRRPACRRGGERDPPHVGHRTDSSRNASFRAVLGYHRTPPCSVGVRRAFSCAAICDQASAPKPDDPLTDLLGHRPPTSHTPIVILRLEAVGGAFPPPPTGRHRASCII
jgi:hypothetical protein